MQILLEKRNQTDSQPSRFSLRVDRERVQRIRLKKEISEKYVTNLFENLAWQGPIVGFDVKKTPPDWQNISEDFATLFTNLEVPLPSLQTESPELDLFEQERETFLRIKDDLLEQGRYLDEFVAIHNGEIVGHDRDVVALARRVYAEYGYVPIYIDKVERDREVIELPSPEA